MKRRVFLALVCLLGALFRPPLALSQQSEEVSSPRSRTPLTILQINDVYSSVPVDGQGGLARVATLKQRLVTEGRTPFLIIAGDFLSPSVESSVFQGEQMVAALNAIGLDLATFGNHEFDFGKEVLLKRMAESRFPWLASNVVDTATGKPLGGAPPYLIKTFGNLKVGFIGLCVNTAEVMPDKMAGMRIVEPLRAAARYIPILKQRGANVIVAVTHLTFAEDRALVARFPEIDLVIGGHEHFPITVTQHRTLISKAGSDAKWVARIDVSRPAPGRVDRFYELVPITSSLPDEPRAAAVVKSYADRLSKELDNVVGTSTVELDALAARLRTGESNLGDLVADILRDNGKADVAIVNGGSVRGDRIYPAGPITRRTILAIHPFGNTVCVIAVPGRVIRAALESGVSKMPENAGQFPQVSGLTMTVNPRAPVGSRVSDVTINGQSLDPDKSYRLAIPDFVLKGGDSYTMLAGHTVIVGPESGDLMATAFEKYLAATGTISPRVDGRITIR